MIGSNTYKGNPPPKIYCFLIIKWILTMISILTQVLTNWLWELVYNWSTWAWPGYGNIKCHIISFVELKFYVGNICSRTEVYKFSLWMTCSESPGGRDRRLNHADRRILRHISRLTSDARAIRVVIRSTARARVRVDHPLRSLMYFLYFNKIRGSCRQYDITFYVIFDSITLGIQSKIS